MEVKKEENDTSSKRIRKSCTKQGCNKVDAGGGFCVSHGGGKKCGFEGCNKGYQTGGFCRRHGGGARCQVEGCNKVDAGKGLCRAHGGGKRCQVENCSKADVGGGFCTAHGGGRRCSEPGCTKIDQGGGKCRAHGGVKRCKRSGCTQTARGKSGFCSDHGGAKICSTTGCRRLAKDPLDSYCANCIRSQLDKALQANPAIQPGVEPNVLAASSTTSSPVRSNSVASTPTASASCTNCSMRNMQNCLENGCAISFGGSCNCKDGCCCNVSKSIVSPTSSSAAADALVNISQSPLQQTFVSQPQQSQSLSESLIENLVPASGTIGSIPLKRILLEISSQIFQVDIFLQLLRTVPFVRSTHVLSVGSSSPTNTSGIILMAVCGEATMDLMSISNLLDTLPQVVHKCLSEKLFLWNRQEIVLHVDGMMCVGNCGNTVMRAIQANVPHVDTANLDFETRRVIVRGEMQVNDLLAAIEDVGFEPTVKATTPIPKRFLFRVKKLYEMSFIGKKLEHLLQKIEGVEQVIVMPEKAEVLVIGLLAEPTLLLGTAARNGLLMVEIPESPQITPTALTPTSFQQTSANMMQVSTPTSTNDTTSTPGGENHVCDLKVCPQNGCQQYMATVAHTAALAVGWVVPGCAMSWGGECTCGENCKCKGCPKHNPTLPPRSSSSTETTATTLS